MRQVELFRKDVEYRYCNEDRKIEVITCLDLEFSAILPRSLRAISPFWDCYNFRNETKGTLDSDIFYLKFLPLLNGIVQAS